MKKFALLLAALLMTGAVQSKKEKDIAGHVVIIGFDGWGSYAMREKGKVPNIRHYMSEGCYTLNKRTMRPSISGPNWAAQMNGTMVEASGIIGNETKPVFKPLLLTEHDAQPTFFHLMRQERPDAELGIVCEWSGFQYYADTLCLNYNKRIHEPSKNPEAIVKESVKYIKEKKPVICFIHVDAMDHAGHSYGRGTDEYYATMEHCDGQIPQILDAVKEAGYYDDCIFILTSDHGHNGTGHGGDTLDEIETPFVIWGKGVKKGKEITDPVLQIDVAATVAKIFHLKTPKSWRGQPIDVFK